MHKTIDWLDGQPYLNWIGSLFGPTGNLSGHYILAFNGEPVASIPRPITLDASSLEQAIGTLQERLDALKTSLAQQQKLATLGMVTAVIAHEFNNILTPMISYTQYALSNKSDDALREKALQKALLGAERAVAISKSLLGFARGDESTAANIKQCIAESLSCLSREPSKDGITLTIEVDPDLWVFMNAGQFQQVLMNLIVNARSAMVAKGRHGPRRLTLRAAQLPQEKVRLSITDTGPGIDRANQKRIFEPFFSTKPADSAIPAESKGGTGLGLTICHELITAANGSIRVESEPGNGATFIIDLPAAAHPPAAVAPLAAKVA